MVSRHLIKKIVESIEVEQDEKGSRVGYVSGNITTGKMLTYGFRDTLKKVSEERIMYYPYIVSIEGEDLVPAVALPTGLTSYSINTASENVNTSIDSIISYINSNIQGAMTDKILEIPNGDFNSVINEITPSSASGNAIAIQAIIAMGDWFNATSPILIMDLLNFYSPNINLLLKYDNTRGEFFFVLKRRNVLESSGSKNIDDILFEGANSSHWPKIAKNLWIFADFAKFKFRVPKVSFSTPKPEDTGTKKDVFTRADFDDFENFEDFEEPTTTKAKESSATSIGQGNLISLLDILMNARIYVTDNPVGISSIDDAEPIENFGVSVFNNALKAIARGLENTGTLIITNIVPQEYLDLFRQGDEFVKKFISAFYNADFGESQYYQNTNAGTVLFASQNTDLISQFGNVPKPYLLPLVRRELSEIFSDPQNGKAFYNKNREKILSAIYKKVPKVLADMSSTSYDLSNIIYNFWSSLLSNPYYYMRLIAADYKGGNFIFRFVDQYGLIPSNKEMGKINVSRTIYDSIYKAYADRDDIEEIYNFCSSVVHNLTPADLVSDPEDQRYMGHLLEFLKRMANVEGDFEYVPEDVMKAEIEKLMSIFKDRQKLEKTLEENPDYVDDYFETNLFRGYDVYNYDPQKHRGFWCKIYTLYQSYIVNINENEQPIEGHWLKEPNPDKAYEKIIEITPKFFKEEEWRNFLKHLLVRSIASYTDLKVDIVDSNGNALDYRLFVSKMKEELVKILDPNADTSKIFWGISKLDVETVFMNNYSVIVSDASLASESEKSQLFNRFIQNRTGLLNALNLLGASWNNATIAATFGKERFFFNKGNK